MRPDLEPTASAIAIAQRARAFDPGAVAGMHRSLH
jgi:hypothetical protein